MTSGRKTLKCYIGNLDGKREGLVFAATQKEAAVVAGRSLSEFRKYWSEAKYRPHPQDPKPLTLYTRPYSRGPEWVWVEEKSN